MANPGGDDRLFALGDDLAGEILVRLPVVDLCRSLCVSKRWNTTISSPSFDNRHHREYLPSACISCGFLYHLLDPGQSSIHALDISQVEDIPCRHHEYKHSLASILGRLRSMTLDGADQPLLLADTHSGVVLLVDKNVRPEHYLLCNPLTQQRVALPEPPASNFPHRIVKLSIVDGGARFLVVALHWQRTAPSVEIQTFYSDTGEWRTTALSAGVLFPTGVSSPTLIGETLYWVDDDGKVSAFETKEGRFFKLPLPDPVTLDCNLYNGRLCPSAGKLYYVYFQLWYLARHFLYF